jgi:HK97 family phage portal protein
MGLLEKLFPKKYRDPVGVQRWETLTAYSARFTTRRGELYEFDQVRSAIDTLARNTGKLQIEMTGTAKGKMRTKLKIKPNEYQTWYQFWYRTRTIYEMQNNAIIIPILDEYDNVAGLFPVLPSSCDVVTYRNTEFLRYMFYGNRKAAIELDRCGIITKHQYKDDIFGDTNIALNGTLDLLDMNRQAIKQAIKESNSFKFVARMNNYAKDEDIEAERKRVKEANMKDKEGFLLLFSNLIGEPKQINYTPYTIDEKEVALINGNIEKYFGVSVEAIKNELTGDKASAFYEGAIEPFAIQASEVITNMLFTAIEQSTGNMFALTANRIQFMTNADKLNISSSMADRGLMTINEIRAIWQLPPIEGGDRLVARGEYYYMDPTADPSKQEQQEDEENAE